MKKVFVYGTLKKGGALHGNMHGAKFVESTTIDGFEMYNVSGWYPAIVKSDDPESKIHGEVYEIDDDLENRLDAVEGYPDLYQKEFTDKGIVYFMEDGESIKKTCTKVRNNNWNVNGNN